MTVQDLIDKLETIEDKEIELSTIRDDLCYFHFVENIEFKDVYMETGYNVPEFTKLKMKKTLMIKFSEKDWYEYINEKP